MVDWQVIEGNIIVFKGFKVVGIMVGLKLFGFFDLSLIYFEIEAIVVGVFIISQVWVVCVDYCC